MVRQKIVVKKFIFTFCQYDNYYSVIKGREYYLIKFQLLNLSVRKPFKKSRVEDKVWHQFGYRKRSNKIDQFYSVLLSVFF